MYDWQEQQRRTNEQGAAWLQQQREEQRRRAAEEQQREAERRQKNMEEQQREAERRRKNMEEQDKQWREQQKQWEHNNSYSGSSSYSGGSYSSAATDVPWSSLNWFEKALRIPGIILNLILLLVIRIPLLLFALGIVEALIRNWLFSNVEQNPESFITAHLLSNYLLFLKTVYEIVVPIIQQLWESASQFIQSFLEG